MALFDVWDPLHGITPRFSEEEMADIVTWFDRVSKPLISRAEEETLNAVTVEKLLGFLKLKKFHKRYFHYPTYAELMWEVEFLKAGSTRLLTKDQIIYMLNQWVLGTTLKQELTLAFKVFDTEERNFLDIDEIETIVTEYGDVFSPEETRELLRDANVRGDGNVYYEDFVESMFSLAPEMNDIHTEYLYENPEDDPSVAPDPVIEEPPEAPPPPPPPPEPVVPAKGAKGAKGAKKKK